MGSSVSKGFARVGIVVLFICALLPRFGRAQTAQPHSQLGERLQGAPRQAQSELPIKSLVRDCEPGTPGCHYINPRCLPAPNNDYLAIAKVPHLPDIVTPGIDKIGSTHRNSYPTYTLPLDVLWESLGIVKILSQPREDCCNPGIKFTRDLKIRNMAGFDWSGSADTMKHTANVTIPVEIELRLPNAIGGLVIVGAGFTEFEFDAQSPHQRMHLRITDVSNGSPSKTFDDDIACFNATPDQVVIRGDTWPSDPNHPYLVIKAK